MPKSLTTSLNRRSFLSAAALTAGQFAFGQTSPVRPVRITLGTEPGLAIAADFLGLGYEISSVARLGLLSSANRVYTQLVRTLDSHGVIRIGGNTADYADYSPKAQALSTSYGSMVNDAVLDDLGRFLAVTNWSLIWALNLGRGTVEQAVAEAQTIRRIAGPRLLALEIGNEPDLFPNEKHRPAPYTYEQWLGDYRRFKSAIREALPGVPLAGPDTAGHLDWVERYAAEEGRDAVLLTHHYYRENQNPSSTIDKLLAPDPRLQDHLDQLRAASISSRLPYRICEVNSFSGGGRPGVSDTMAAALWVLDYMYILASNGCAGVNMETGVNQHDFISSYSPIGDDERGHYTARPEYYGMLAFAQSGHGRLLPVTLDASVPGLRAYATLSSSQAIALTLINKSSHTLVVAGDLPRGTRQATLLRLTAPAIDAMSGVTLGGAAVAPDGTWKPRLDDHLAIKERTFTLELPAGSAAIVRMA